MPNTNRALIIIGSNANIVNDIIVEIEKSNYFEKITLISTSKAPKKQNKLYEEISCTNDVLNKKIVKSIKAGLMTSMVFTNIPSRNKFNSVTDPSYLINYINLFEIVKNMKNIEKVFFLGSATGTYFNIFNRKYNSYRIEEVLNFADLWAKSTLSSTLFLLPPLDTSRSLIGRLLFTEKRGIWAQIIVERLRDKNYNVVYEFPYRLLTRVIVQLFVLYRLKIFVSPRK